MAPRVAETELYAPVKALLEAQGFEVKAEVVGADVVGLRPGEKVPVIVELKAGFSLTLFHQGIARQAVTDAVYLAVPHGGGRPFQLALRRNLGLCRRLGLGLMTVRLRDGHVQVHLDPAPFRPRKSARRQGLLLREFARREGDPNIGGKARGPLISAYRQDALRLAAHLAAAGPSRGAEVAGATGVAAATRMMATDPYGWFERVSRGEYRLTIEGHTALDGSAD
ncbi:DUF2161 domain-containing phosphodiesterase [Tropicimonas sp. IMCC34043]|uniref:DUF2161 domain-containing phosphodiesterase n=1 Tax=Tropicimonas sp. IMCC34043 TaxID=2248760 RepID=UPI0018E51B3D|nr:DUF2161 family putative PD-(D/E)XK-type phosphodiesterase [Tropicimonas sp. IMCC34043]